MRKKGRNKIGIFQKTVFPGVLDAVPRAYESAGTLRGMLTLLVEQCPKENGRAKAALDYLEHSRYRGL